MEIVITWIVLSLVVGFLGTDRKIGGGWAFLVALLLSPIVGFIIIGFYPSKATLEYRERHLKELSNLVSELRKVNNTGKDDLQNTVGVNRENNKVVDELIEVVPKLSLWQKIKYGL